MTPVKLMTSLLLSLTATVLLSCSGKENLAGNSSKEGPTEITGIINADGDSGAEGIIVTLYPVDFNPVTDAVGDSMRDITDEKGRYYFRDIPGGTYNIHALHPESDRSALVRDFEVPGENSDTLISAPGALLEHTGSITLYLDELDVEAGGHIYIAGTGLNRQIDTEGAVTLDNAPAGEYPTVIYSAPDLIEKEISAGIAVGAGAEGVIGPYHAWSDTLTVVINTAPTGADVSGDVTGFPLLVRLDNGSGAFASTRPDGADLRLSWGDGLTPLAFEIERWDAAAGQAEVWVKLDTIYGGSSSQFIYMYTGNPDAAAVSSSGDVFDLTNDFAGVWHYADDPAGPPPQMIDATDNGSHGTAHGDITADASVEAAIGRGLLFDGTNDYVRMDGVSPLLSDGDPITFSVWFKTGDHHRSYFISGGSNTLDGDIFRVGLSDSGQIQISTSQIIEDTGSTFEDDEWHFVTATLDGQGARKVRVDGVEIADYTAVVPARFSLMMNVISGMEWDDNTPTNHFKGTMDELRLSRTLRTEAWIRLSYENQRPGSVMLTIE